MTYSTAMYYLGYDPYTGKTVYCAKTQDEKKAQNQFFHF